MDSHLILTTTLASLMAFLAFALAPGHAQAAPVTVSVLTDREPGPGATHGLRSIETALQAKGIAVERARTFDDARGKVVILTGLATGSGAAAKLLAARDIAMPEGPEALVIRRTRLDGKQALLVVGSDDRGLMYAELEVADRIGWAADPSRPLSEVQNASEQPAVPERALSKVVMNQSEFERYCFSEDYWTEYLDMLARDRFSTFLLMFGYSAAGYFDPPYPFLFDVEGFPQVRVVGITEEEQRRNLEMLNRIIRMTHERGLDFTLAIWTHINRGVNEPTPGLVWGLTDDNLVAYTRAALAKFLKLVPELDAIQFRVHIESSVALPQQIPFWTTVLKAIKDSGRDLRVDMRVKGFTDDMIEAALASGVRVRLATKYWGEQMGLPFHPTHIIGKDQFTRRHTYADLLTYPQRYKMHYRLWNLGTTRILLWGDPEYVRRFADSTHLCGGDGFEVHEPLAFKMGHHRGDTYDLLAPEHQYYDWEFERYWHFFQVFGRVGYNPKADPRVWMTEFERRFGEGAGPSIEQALHRASQILPRIVAYNLSDLSADHAWAEKQRWNDLPTYANSEPSDTAQFLGIEEAARYHLAGEESARIWPEQTSRWFARAADDVLALVGEAEKRIGSHKSKEFDSTMVDLKVLAALARYHSRRIHAGLSWAFFRDAQDLNALDDAIQPERGAIETWEGIVALTDGVYHGDLIMGRAPRLTGSWKDELAELHKGLQQLQEQRAAFPPQHREVVARFDFGDGPAEEGFQKVDARTRYDRTRGGHGWQQAYLLPSPQWQSGPVEPERERDFLHGPPPMQYTHSAFTMDLPNGHYELSFSMVDRSTQPRDYGPMWIVANGMDSTERFVVPAGELVEKTLATAVTDGKLNVVFNSASSSKWMVNSMVVTRVEPVIAHVPIRRAVPGAALAIRATISGPDPIRDARVVYGSAGRGYKSIAMQQAEPHLYHCEIPGSAVAEGLEYFIEVSDAAGRRVTFPREGGAQPIRVVVTSDTEPPQVTHAPVTSCTLGKPVTIVADVRDPSGVKWVRLRYRGVTQHQDFRTLPMLPTARAGRYQAEIPAGHLRPEWDLMYFIEAMDACGNGRIHPDLERETPYVVVSIGRM